MSKTAQKRDLDFRVLLRQLQNDLSLALGQLELARNTAAKDSKLEKRLEALEAALSRMATRVGGQIQSPKTKSRSKSAAEAGPSEKIKAARAAIDELDGTLLKYDEPFEPAVPLDDWEAFN